MNFDDKYFQAVKTYFTVLYDQFLIMAAGINLYYQIAACLVIFIIAYSIARFLRSKNAFWQEKDIYISSYSKRWFVQRSGRLIFPVLALVLLEVIEPVFANFIEKLSFINAVQRVSFVWFLWVALRAFVIHPLVRTVGLWILIPAAFLQIFGWLEPVITYLDSYGMKLGDINITLYTVMKAILFASLIMWAGKIVSKSGEAYIRRSRTVTGSTKELLIKLFDIVLYTGLFLITLNLIGIELGALAVFGGALGVGLGFGLQTIASNFISGIILLSERSININNLIEMDDGVFGYVRKLGARASIVETLDGKEVMVPNEDFITSRVANLTHSSSKGRIDVMVGVSYDSDLHLVYDLILKAACNYDKAIQDDEEFEPKCFLTEYGDSSVNFFLTFWLEDITKGRWRAKSDVMFAIWDSFKEHNIEIPYPQRDLHIRSGLDKFENALTQKIRTQEKEERG